MKIKLAFKCKKFFIFSIKLKMNSLMLRCRVFLLKVALLNKIKLIQFKILTYQFSQQFQSKKVFSFIYSSSTITIYNSVSIHITKLIDLIMVYINNTLFKNKFYTASYKWY